MWLSANLFSYICHLKSGKFWHSSWNHNENKALKTFTCLQVPKSDIKGSYFALLKTKLICLRQRLLVMYLITYTFVENEIRRCMCMVCRSYSHRPLCKFMYAHTQVNARTSAKSAVVSSTSKVTTSDICELSTTSLFTRLLSNRLHLTNTCCLCFTFFGSHTNRVSTIVSHHNLLKY